MSLQIGHHNIHSSTNEGSYAQKTPNSSSNNMAPIHPILQLQQTVGNQVVERLACSGIIQAKLKVSNPNDPYERGADRIAEQGLRMSMNSEDIALVNTINEEKIKSSGHYK